MDASAEISHLIEESRALERGGRIPAAIHRAVQARQLAQACANTESEAAALNALAYAHIRLGHYPQAVAFSQAALALAGPESRARAEALLNINICASETNDLDTGEKYLLQAIDLARQTGDERILARGLHSISCGIYMPRGQFALSLAADEEAVNIIRSSGLMELLWGPILTMSWVYWLTGQYRLTASRLDELRANLLPNSLADGYWHYIHGNLAIESGDYETARGMLQQTRTIAESNGITENLFLAHLGMSRLSRLLNDAPAALGWADEAYRLMETMPHNDEAERFCNRVAAEFLVPGHKLSERWNEAEATGRPFHTIARWHKVSPVVAARRALDLGLITKDRFFVFYERDQEDWRRRKAEKKTRKGGPNFYDVQDVRLGKRFAYAVVRAAREGRLLYRDAYQLTDLQGETFNRYANRLVQRMKDERR